ncbi:(Trans)glycosidase [Glarea lozoyensis ATCC 20868]|nr:(Trans)glycosidase [Glarea lozoyensis ATCC 20868]EPE27542.1 (Trans)glycosidase [Glarea lozoyensis ATCC 20868]
MYTTLLTLALALAQTSTATPTPTLLDRATQARAAAIWTPTAGTTWQMQLYGSVTKLDFPVEVYDIDVLDNLNTGVIAKLHAANKKVVCYFSAGSYENWRTDTKEFGLTGKDDVNIGKPMIGWDGEWWFQTSSTKVRDLMRSRIKKAAAAGCDAIDPDNIDGYDSDDEEPNKTGFNLSLASATEYVKFLAAEAHALGMGMGLKNGLDLIPNVLNDVQFQVQEQCAQFPAKDDSLGSECLYSQPFIKANKPVFHVEYPTGETLSNTIPAAEKKKDCQDPNAKGFSSIMKGLDLMEKIAFCT